MQLLILTPVEILKYSTEEYFKRIANSSNALSASQMPKMSVLLTKKKYNENAYTRTHPVLKKCSSRPLPGM